MKNKGYEDLSLWFGLTRANWLTIPRVMMEAMPNKWQEKMARLLNEFDDTWDSNKVELETTVRLMKDKKIIRMPEWMKNYRHPDYKFIESLKLKK